METKVGKRYHYEPPYEIGDLMNLPDEGAIKQVVVVNLPKEEPDSTPELVNWLGRGKNGNSVLAPVGIQFQPTIVNSKKPKVVSMLLRTIYTLQSDGFTTFETLPE